MFKYIESGKFVIKGTRFTISQLLSEIADCDGQNLEDICKNSGLESELVKNILLEIGEHFDEMALAYINSIDKLL